MQAKSYPDGINTNTNITMNTVRQRQRLGIKRSILTALLMGFCCLFYAPEAFSQDEPGAPSQRTAMDDDFDKSMAQARQQYGNRLYQQYMGGATTAKERAIGVLRMENAIAEAEGKGDTAQANALRQQLAMAQSNNEWSTGHLQQKANAGDTRAQRELDEYYAFMKTVEGSSPGEAFPCP